jgi:hypothetical protein
MSGWIVGNYSKINARERFFCMLAASIPDFDGLGIVVSQDAYFEYHHILGHNILFGVVAALILTALSKHKIKCFLLYMALFHLHILMDLFGSGECWTVSYLYPFSNYQLESKISWALYSWQNIVVNFSLLLWTIILIFMKKRTPLEYIMPAFDKKWTAIINQIFLKIPEA